MASLAITTIFAITGRSLNPYMPDILTVETWKRTYTSNFPLIDISRRQPLPLSECHPPLTRVPRGRPKKERFRKEDIRGPRGEAAAQAMAEPAGDGDDEVWVPYHCSTESEVTFLLLAGVHTYKFAVGVLSTSNGILIFSVVF